MRNEKNITHYGTLFYYIEQANRLFKEKHFRSPSIFELSQLLQLPEEKILESMEFHLYDHYNLYPTMTRVLI
ncbi:hypothetical protein [Bacillus taeanensis]|uniref:Uncharacterized protein n=1 Tax=Bacillus taeanensis TaxID=273032 RepID=A0A366Y2L4_9BACI|nr:hypothetical protein [Bacillus taeanensis]RBW70634.1 hypothetical protein DS031_06395 [Bacillus taeanensis]